MDIQLTANAGLIVTFANGRSVFIDALHCRRTRFSPVSTDVIERVMDIPVDLVLVTHAHNDHYDEELTARYMQRHPQAVLISPAPLPGIPEDRQHVLQNKEGSFEVNAIAMEYVRLRHEGDKYKDVPNYGYAVRTGGESIAVLGDAAMDEVYRGLMRLTDSGPLLAAGVNFPILTLRKGLEALQDVQVQNLIGMHLPFVQDDVEGYRQSAQRAAPRISQKTGIPVTLLLEEEQHVHIE